MIRKQANKPREPRYFVKFVNQAWVVFDAVQYRNISAHGLWVQADAAARRVAGLPPARRVV